MLVRDVFLDNEADVDRVERLAELEGISAGAVSRSVSDIHTMPTDALSAWPPTLAERASNWYR